MNVYYIAMGLEEVNDSRRLESIKLNNGSLHKEWVKQVKKDEAKKLGKPRPEVKSERPVNVWSIIQPD